MPAELRGGSGHGGRRRARRSMLAARTAFPARAAALDGDPVPLRLAHHYAGSSEEEKRLVAARSTLAARAFAALPRRQRLAVRLELDGLGRATPGPRETSRQQSSSLDQREQR